MKPLDTHASKKTSRAPEPLPCVDGEECDGAWWLYEGLDRGDDNDDVP